MTPSDTRNRQRLPKISILSIAILENLVEKVVGEAVIDEIKKPYAQKEIADSLRGALARVETEFVAQSTDRKARNALLQLPIHSLPSAQTAIWNFYERPNDRQFEALLIVQLKLVKRLSVSQIETAVAFYMKLLRRELANIDPELREKFRTLALLDIADTVKDVLHTLTRERGLTSADADALKGYLAEVRQKWNALMLPLIRRKRAGGDILNAKLKQVFVPLKLRDVRAEEESLHHMALMLKLGKPIEEEETIHVMEIGELLNRYPRFVLLGPPGCGKTTLLNRVALAFAEGHAAEELGWQGVKLFPIFLRLRNFGTFLKLNRDEYPEPSSGTLVAYLENQFREGERLNMTADFFDRRLAEGNCIILLDGLDEVSEARSEVASHLDAFIERYGSNGNHIGMASRRRGYESVELAMRRIGLAVLEVNRLEIGGISQLVSNLLDIIEPDPGLRAHNLADLTNAIDTSEELTRIAGTPLFCSALVQVYKYNNARLPHRRVDIFDEIVDLLLGNWHAQQRYLSEAHQLAIDDGTGKQYREVRDAVTIKLRRLSHLADVMQQRFRRSEISKEEAKEILIEYLMSRERVPNSDIAQTWAENFLINSHERSGLLVENEPEVYSFLHKGFMEYLSATALVNQSKTLVETLIANINDPWWEQITLLAGAHPRLAEDVRVELINSLLDKAEALPPDSDHRWKHIILAGELARNMAEYLPGSEHERVEKILDAAATNADNGPMHRASAANTLDELGYLPEDLFMLVALPSFPYPCYLAKYPVTNAQYERFLRREYFENKDLWCAFPRYTHPDRKGKIVEIGHWDNEGWEWLQNALNDKEYNTEDGVLLPRYWRDRHFGISRKNVPVVGITWYEANAYCKWLTQHWSEQPEAEYISSRAGKAHHSSFTFRLPTEIEWEAATGGKEPEGRFAWGELSDEQAVTRFSNTSESGINRTTPVWMYPLGISANGMMDMSGNVWEWQANYSGDEYGGQRALSLRGGSWHNNHDWARVTFRNINYPNIRNHNFGFRVICLLTE